MKIDTSIREMLEELRLSIGQKRLKRGGEMMRI